MEIVVLNLIQVHCGSNLMIYYLVSLTSLPIFMTLLMNNSVSKNNQSNPLEFFFEQQKNMCIYIYEDQK
jgi:hypothetical protein